LAVVTSTFNKVMPHIDIERLVLNYSYHIILCITFSITAALRAYISRTTLHNILKLKLHLVNALRYNLRIKN